jgi:hypothetical protein
MGIEPGIPTEYYTFLQSASFGEFARLEFELQTVNSSQKVY